MNHIHVHIERLVVPDDRFDVAGFSAAVRRRMLAEWEHPPGERRVAAVRTTRAGDATAKAVGRAVADGVLRSLR